MEKRTKNYSRKTKPKFKKSLNIFLGVVIFVALIGSAFAISILFGVAFIIAFSLAVYTGELKKKPWKPMAIFIGAVLIRLALKQYLDPVLASKTLLDLAVSALIFLSILIFGWKIKKS